MAQITDPRQGTQRQKALLKRIAGQAMMRKGYKSKVGTFGKLAAAGGQSRAMRPLRGPGSAIKSARPGGFESFFDGMNTRPNQPQPGYVNTAPVAAPVPGILPGPPQQSNAATMGDLAPVTTQPGYEDPASNPWEQTPPQFNANGQEIDQRGGLMEAGSSYHQASPSGPITAPGGLIPLGDGRYYNPNTGEIHGGGGGMNFKAM